MIYDAKHQENAERSMREDDWITAAELLKTSSENKTWAAAEVGLSVLEMEHEIEDGDTSLKFFNYRKGEFSSQSDWVMLAASEGHPVFDVTLALPDNLPLNVTDAFKQLRQEVWAAGGANEEEAINTGGCRAFYNLSDGANICLTASMALLHLGRGDEPTGCLAVVCHDGGDLARWFNLDYGCYDLHARMTDIFQAHGLWCEQQNAAITCVYANPGDERAAAASLQVNSALKDLGEVLDRNKDVIPERLIRGKMLQLFAEAKEIYTPTTHK